MVRWLLVASVALGVRLDEDPVAVPGLSSALCDTDTALLPPTVSDVTDNVVDLSPTEASLAEAGSLPWRTAVVHQGKGHDVDGGRLDSDVMKIGANDRFWQAWLNTYHPKGDGPEPPPGHIVIGVHGTTAKRAEAILAQGVNISKSKPDHQMFGKGFYMLNGYSVNDKRPAQNVTKIAQALNSYAEMGHPTGSGRIIAFCVAVRDLEGMSFQVLPGGQSPTGWDEVYAARTWQSETLPDPEDNVWTPAFRGDRGNIGGHGHMAEVKAGRSLHSLLKPFAIYHSHREKRGPRVIRYGKPVPI